MDERRSVLESWLRSVHATGPQPPGLTNRFVLITEGTSTTAALASSLTGRGSQPGSYGAEGGGAELLDSGAQV